MKNTISSCLAQCFVSFSYSYFYFTVAGMPSSLNPSNDHNHISSTCLYLKNCRWFFSALCWYVAFCCYRAAPVVVPFPPSGCSPRAGFLVGHLPLVAQRGISAHKKGVFGVQGQIHPSLRTRILNRCGFLVFLVFPPTLLCQPLVY